MVEMLYHYLIFTSFAFSTAYAPYAPYALKYERVKYERVKYERVKVVKTKARKILEIFMNTLFIKNLTFSIPKLRYNNKKSFYYYK